MADSFASGSPDQSWAHEKRTDGRLDGHAASTKTNYRTSALGLSRLTPDDSPEPRHDAPGARAPPRVVGGFLLLKFGNDWHLAGIFILTQWYTGVTLDQHLTSTAMPTQKARINLSVPDDIHKLLIKLAKRDDVPVAAKTLELLKEAIELEEDRVMSTIAELRMKNTTKWHSFDEVWKEYMN